ncbi:MAG: hypothetical protein IKC40_03715 [Oscillospiraceae bacterium]|nr:hypothetical protein [Oscillospiraceae bacterium]MBR6617079.1 hypothetical protein [Oscillospiraceae bacterium]
MDERQNPICSHCGQVIETDDYSFVHAESGGTVFFGEGFAGTILEQHEFQ